MKLVKSKQHRGGANLDMRYDISFVTQKKLCTGCATCVGVCPQNCITIELNQALGLREPVVARDRCVSCGVCVRSCPGYQLDLVSLRPLSQVGLEEDFYLGAYSALYVGCSNNDDVRIPAASGGMVSEVLIYLLESGCIDGAVVTRMSSERPLETETFIARTRDDILSAQKSKYCPAPVNTILRDICRSKGRYAFVGLPCHIEGIRKVQKYDEVLSKRLPYILGLFCSRTPTANATRFLLRRLGIAEQSVASLHYRGEGHPGKMKIVLKDGREQFVNHLDYNYWGHVFLNFFYPARCWLCPDKTAELADMSFGDNWTGQSPYDYRKDHKGSSTIIVRSLSCDSLLEEMAKCGRVSILPVPKEMVIASQALPSKKKLAPRMTLWRVIGRCVPQYEHLNERASLKDCICCLPFMARVLLSERQRSFVVLNIAIRIFWFADKFWRRIVRMVRIPKRFL